MKRAMMLALSLLAFAALDEGSAARPATVEGPVTVLIRGCTLYRDAAADPISAGAVIISNGKVEAVGPEAAVQAPKGAKIVSCAGGAIVPAFWNSHIHFSEPK